jgi:hypothetical protein
MAAQQGWDAHSRQLADDMRRLDGADDHLPVVRRFRDQHFGPGQPLQRHDADALQAVRTRLRAAVATLHTRLNETAATTAAD